jgi:hypothetical protein
MDQELCVIPESVVTRIVSNVPTTEFMILGSNLIESEAEIRNLHTCHPGPNDVIVSERGVLTVIAPLQGCTPESVGERLKWTPIV